MQPENRPVTCTECGRTMPLDDTFVLTHAGPTLSLRPLCESCADAILAAYHAILAGQPTEVAHAAA